MESGVIFNLSCDLQAGLKSALSFVPFLPLWSAGSRPGFAAFNLAHTNAPAKQQIGGLSAEFLLPWEKSQRLLLSDELSPAIVTISGVNQWREAVSLCFFLSMALYLSNKQANFIKEKAMSNGLPVPVALSLDGSDHWSFSNGMAGGSLWVCLSVGMRSHGFVLCYYDLNVCT